MRALTILFFLLTFFGHISRCQTALEKQKRAEDALIAFTKAKELLRPDSSHTLSYVALCDSVAKLDFQLGKLEECSAECREALDVLGALHDNSGPAHAGNMYMLGVVCAREKKWPQAIHFLQACKAEQESLKATRGVAYANTCSALAYAYGHTGSYAEAESLFRLTIGLFEGLQIGRAHV